MAELLLELLSEEIPARMQARAAEDLKRLVCDGLKGAGLEFGSALAFATPRRLALVVDGIPAMREDVSEERRGPRVGAPDNAVQGFLKGAGLASLDQAEKRDTGKGEFWFAVITRKGGPTEAALPGVLDAALKALPWPKSMKWGSGTLQWVRPLQSIVALFDGKVLAGEVTPGGSMAPVKFGDSTVGHRFLSKGEIKVTSFAHYQAKLKAAHVVLDPAERKKIILDGAQKLCAEAGVTLKADEGLLDEVAGLVEWPVPLLGTIDAQFMDVPPEVLIVSMKTHQRYFATTNTDGSLANRFVVVANTVAHDGGKVIVDGNERVLRARLSDAKFFWDQDRKVRLEDRLPALRNMVFHAKLGSQADRVRRIVDLAIEISKYVPNAQPSLAAEAAKLSKADLVTGMVGEFPELQGVMGGYYARHDGLASEIAIAIADQYSPAGPTDRCPDEPVAIAVAIAEKLETLGSLWSTGERPSGSRDPYALRRATLGILRIMVERNIRFDLVLPLFQAILLPRTLVKMAEYRATLDEIANLANRIGPSPGLNIAMRDLAVPIDWSVKQGGITAPEYFNEVVAEFGELLKFVRERIRIQARDRGVRHDVIDAVISIPGDIDPTRLFNLSQELEKFLQTSASKDLLTAYGRAANIVRAEVKKHKELAEDLAHPPEIAKCEKVEEKVLFRALQISRSHFEKALQDERFGDAVSELSSLREPVDAFFNNVTVNVSDKPDLRLNRLRLLKQIQSTMDSVADFSKIEG